MKYRFYKNKNKIGMQLRVSKNKNEYETFYIHILVYEIFKNKITNNQDTKNNH